MNIKKPPPGGFLIFTQAEREKLKAEGKTKQKPRLRAAS